METPSNIQVQSTGTNSPPTKIQWKDPTEAHRTLGIHLAPKCSVDAQVHILEQKAKAFSKSMEKSILLNVVKQTACCTCIKPSLTNPLMAHNFLPSDLQPTQTYINKIIFHSRGLNCHFPKALTHGPLRYGSLGEGTLYAKHGVEKMAYFLHHIRNNDKGFHQLTAMLGYSQLELGSAKSMFALDYNWWGTLVTATWTTELWHFLQEIDG